MTAQAILEAIKPLARESYKRILLTHHAKEPCFGVTIEELKKIQKRVKKDYCLALDLYETGVYEAMYLAGLIADDALMTRKDLEQWVKKSDNGALSGSTVPSVAAGSPHGWELGLEWIGSDKEHVAVAGWGTLSGLVSVKDDADLDLAQLKRLLQRVKKSIHHAPNDVRYQMNAFVIAVGAYVRPLTALALETAETIGPVQVDRATWRLQSPVRSGLHPQNRESRYDRQEAEVRQMLIRFQVSEFFSLVISEQGTIIRFAAQRHAETR